MAAMVRVRRTGMTERVPWTMLTETENGEGYRLKVGLGELALMVSKPAQSDAVLIWHDGMDWLIGKDRDGYKTAAVDSDT